MSAELTFPVLTVDELDIAVEAHHRDHGREPRHFASDGDVPSEPGVYVWASEGKVLYIGSGADLSRRIGDERRWLSFDAEHDWAESVLYVLNVNGAEVAWVTVLDHDEAKQLERRLIEWHRASVGVAPLAYGWEEKAGSPRAEGLAWARDLWNTRRSLAES